jgi:hypothetical protein
MSRLRFGVRRCSGALEMVDLGQNNGRSSYKLFT